MSKLTYTLIIVGLFFWLLPKKVSANQPINLSVSPPVAYIQVKPGDNYTHRVTIRQNGSLSLKVTPKLVDFKSDGKTGQPILQDKTSFHYAKIITPQNSSENNSFNLNPNQSLGINLEISIPPQALEREYPLSLLLQAEPILDAVNPTQSIVSGVIASNVIVLVKNQTSHQGEIAIKQIKAPLWIDTFSGQLSFKIVAKNPTMFSASASGQVKISNLLSGKTLADWPIYPDMILGDSQRELRRQLDASQAASFNYHGRWWFGLYAITSGDQTVKILALPFVLIVIVLCGLVLYFLNQLLSHKFTLVKPLEN